MSNSRIALILLILSESLGWFYGAQAFWRSRSKIDKKRMTLGILLAFGFTTIGLVALFNTFTNIQYGVQLSACIPPEMAVKSLVSSAVRVASVWVVSLSIASTDKPGPIRQRVNQLIDRWR